MPGVTKVLPFGFADVSCFINVTGDPEPMAQTFGVDVDVEGTWTDANTLALLEAWRESLKPIFPPSCTLGGIRVRVAQAVGDPLVFENTSVEAGTDAEGTRLPQNCAMLVLKRSTQGGRRNRGRLYVPGLLPESAVSNIGVITPASVAIFQGFFTTWRNTFTPTNPANVSAMVLLHSYSWDEPTDPGPPPGFPAPTAVSALEVQGLIATQRRRLRR